MHEQQLSDGMRVAMRRLGATVSVVTACHRGERFAMTATSVTSLSMEPPSLLVCVNRSTTMHAAMAAATEFCVNILAAEHHEVASACGGRIKGDARFALGRWSRSDTGTPLLVDAQANLTCDVDGRFDYGSHSVFIGRVKHIEVREQVNPLGYLNGGYIAALPADGAAAAHRLS